MAEEMRLNEEFFVFRSMILMSRNSFGILNLTSNPIRLIITHSKLYNLSFEGPKPIMFS
jgi:hypothetical protein